MKMTDLFSAQLEREGAITRRVLKRVPERRDDWKPHPKSMLLGYLASLVAMMPGWVAMAIDQDELDLHPPGGGPSGPPPPKNNAELVALFEGSLAKSRESLKKTGDEHLLTRWRLLVGGQVVMESPRHVVIEDTFTHLAHHRGQLTVYMRLNDAPVPSIYGPSADDKSF